MMKCYENPLVAAKIWRYIPPIISSAELQMAIDSWLLEQHRCGHHPPTLRFYQWSPPAISLGYHQRQYPDFWRNLTCFLYLLMLLFNFTSMSTFTVTYYGFHF